MMNLLCGVLAIVLGSVSLFLASPNQNWLPRPLPRGRTRLVALALLLAGLLLLCRVFLLLSSIFVFSCLLMVVLLLCPYLGALLISGRASR
ncbi:hypothetical protein [Paludibacterium sp. B53371]|uniref:hypothetical protein n=1 Tax=Paludibacterium sp. B53371 TaxID=2806263 RepID=UPI001C049871|nr:hypothetical protein [Paludibacterium sp. B53371]